MTHDNRIAIFLAVLSMATFWLFSRIGIAKEYRIHTKEAIRIYSILTAVFLITFIGLVSSGIISKEDGSAIPNKEGPRTEIETKFAAAIFDERVSSWCNYSIKQITGEGFVNFFNMEARPEEGLEFAFGLFLIIVVSKLLNGIIVFLVLGFEKNENNGGGLAYNERLERLSELQMYIRDKTDSGNITHKDIRLLDNMIENIKRSVFDPWQYLYLAIEKVVLVFAAVTSAAFPVAYYYGWISYSILFSACFPIIVTCLSLPLAITISIGASWVDSKMRKNRYLSWLS